MWKDSGSYDIYFSYRMLVYVNGLLISGYGWGEKLLGYLVCVKVAVLVVEDFECCLDATDFAQKAGVSV